MADGEAKGGKSKKVRGVIDRVEDNDTAVIYLDEDERHSIDVPTSMLPRGASDGDHLTITFTLDAESRVKAEGRVREMRERLEKLGGSGPTKKDFKL
jgi:hypothetical protein